MIERIRVAFVDTGPLMSALILDYARQKSARRESILSRCRLGDYLKNNKSRQDNFSRLFDSIPSILTTSNVIGELQGLQTLDAGYQQGFWENAIGWMQRKGFDEQLIRLLDLGADDVLREMIYQIGPSDTGLIGLARKEACLTDNIEGKVLLTDDHTLRGLARKQGIECQVVKDRLIP